MMKNRRVNLSMVLFIGLVASNVFAAEIANVFRYPVGDENGNGWLLNRRGLQWLDQWDYAGNCGLVYHPGTDFNKDGTSHDGDIGQPVYATANGAVIKSYYESGSSWGNLVLIRHYLPSGEVLFSLYGHLEKRLVSEGDDVAMGQQIGTVGKGIGLSAHLHFEIRKPILFNTAAKYFPCGQDQNFVKLRYFNPESFIKIGRFANMSSAITLKFVERYELKLGVPFQDVGGNIYVHDWDGIMIQNFKNDDETNRYGTDGQTALIYNDDQNKCWLIKEGFWGYYKQNNGPTDFGTPFTDEITAKYANSPFISSGDYVQPGNEIVVQKFQRVNSTERRTLVYNKTSGQSVRRFPVGGFVIDFPLRLC